MDRSFIEQRNELILKAWAAGMATARICAGLDITKGVALGVIYRAREAGDLRAAPRIASSGKGLSRPRTAKSDGPAAIGSTEYQRRRAAERLARAYAYADGSAWA